ncbi:hypothetical protein A1O1_06307 [Capronia coronata CBS 617.96]|uniref:Uncharacterized protein n=1 Tax=Capronia coronata CBS 617.96 TaxID=1182541 RepID=W9Y0E7_9EURO|nr:uncharacterized protein A1O1_06307 [Capronia coronata CBS 617.96]EXJ85938.1 hypothetical protein A1O1_06307 [Capronia coronata CBS 617.96]
MPSSLPPPAKLTADAVQRALELYPLLVERVYKAKLKDPKKVADALKRDKWRFGELPAAIAAINSGGSNETKQSTSHNDIVDGALAKDALERLVQWKM